MVCKDTKSFGMKKEKDKKSCVLRTSQVRKCTENPRIQYEDSLILADKAAIKRAQRECIHFLASLR